MSITLSDEEAVAMARHLEVAQVAYRQHLTLCIILGSEKEASRVSEQILSVINMKALVDLKLRTAREIEQDQEAWGC